MPRKARKSHTADDFDLDVLSSDTDMFRWFLLCYLFGKPIQSGVAVTTWKLFIKKKLDTPWAIVEAGDYKLVSVLHEGGYTRYQHVMTKALKTSMQQLTDFYDGSLTLMIEDSVNEEELSKRLQKFLVLLKHRLFFQQL